MDVDLFSEASLTLFLAMFLVFLMPFLLSCSTASLKDDLNIVLPNQLANLLDFKKVASLINVLIVEFKAKHLQCE